MLLSNWKHWAVGSVAVLTLMAGGALQADTVSAATQSQRGPGQMEMQGAQSADFGPRRMDRGAGGYGEMTRQGQTLLAEALGITVEELEAAQDAAKAKAHDAALADAVAQGDLTQAQADAIKELGGLWGDRQFGRGMPGHVGSFGNGPGAGWEEHDAYLAEALGITVEALDAAKQTAIENGLAQAVAEGTLTQEQADNALTGLALKEYITDELDSVLSSAIAGAVADGVVTQEQADQLQEEWQGFGNRGARSFLPGGMNDDFRDGMRGGARGGMRGGMNDGRRGGMQGGFGLPDSQRFDGVDVDSGETL